MAQWTFKYTGGLTMRSTRIWLFRQALSRFLLHRKILGLIGWDICGLLNWDVWLLKWPLFRKNIGVFQIRIHCAIASYNLKYKQWEHCGGASGSRFGINVFNWRAQIGFDNIVPNSWAFGWGNRHIYPAKHIIASRPNIWWPFWYPKGV